MIPLNIWPWLPHLISNINIQRLAIENIILPRTYIIIIVITLSWRVETLILTHTWVTALQLARVRMMFCCEFTSYTLHLSVQPVQAGGKHKTVIKFLTHTPSCPISTWNVFATHRVSFRVEKMCEPPVFFSWKFNLRPHRVELTGITVWPHSVSWRGWHFSGHIFSPLFFCSFFSLECGRVWP